MAGWRSIPSSIKTAIIIAGGVILYFALSMALRGGTDEVTETEEEPVFRVVTETIEPLPIDETVEMRGRTEARRLVTVRAETPGQVRATPAPEGQFVNRGTVLCEIDVETRSATLEEAQAAYERAKIDYDAAKELAERGFSSDAGLAAAKAGFDQAEAALQRARADLTKTEIRAPFAGILEEQIAEAGDFLNVGAPCATMAELDPIRIRGAVSEKQVAAVREGNMATITLATGQSFPAEVTYVGAAANQATRTYSVELEAENPGTVRAGQTATALINIGNANGWLLPHDVVITSDEGQTGVRIVERTGARSAQVDFLPVTITADDQKGFYVTGLSGSPEVIVRGQNYVSSGETVEIAAPGETYATQGTAGNQASD